MNRLPYRLPQIFHFKPKYSETTYRKVLVGSFSCSLGYYSTVRNTTVLAKTPQVKQSQSLHRSRKNGFTWRKLWQFLKNYWFELCFGIGFAMMSAFFNVQIPISLGSITGVLSDIIKTNNVLTMQEYWDLIKTPTLRFCTVIAAQAVSSALTVAAITSVGENLARDLRYKLFEAFERQDLIFFEINQSGDLIKRINSDIQEFKSDFKKLVSQGVKSTTQTMGVVGILYHISPSLTVGLGAGVTGLVTLGSLIAKVLRKKSMESQELSSRAQMFSTESLNNQRTVRSFANEDYHISKYEQLITDSTASAKAFSYGIAVFQGLTNLALNGIVGVTVLSGGLLLGTGNLSSADLMSFLGATQMLQKSLATMSQLMTIHVKMTISGDRVFEYLDLATGQTVSGGKIIPRWKMIGDIRFQHVGFTYSTRETPVLSDFNLTLARNQTAALVGTSGNGKSTIAALLARLYDPESGAIYIDGINLKQLDSKWLRNEMIGYIGQEPVLFSGTIADNIRYGCLKATMEDIVEAAKRANADTFISSFPNGYDTTVGERGASLSGGQKQRIAIARAIIKNPQILILDEATSALDPESERVVQVALERNFEDRTVLIIAHRLSTIKNANVIHVIENGEIIESGNHKTLMAKRGAYFYLHNK